MPIRFLLGLLVLAVVEACAPMGRHTAAPQAVAPQAEAPQTEAGASLYERLGGYDTIAAVVYEFDRRWVKDPLLNALSVGFSADSGKRQVQLFIEYLCERSGGPCTYLGRDMKTTHAGLTLTEAHWKAFMTHLADSFDAIKTPAKEKAEALAILEQLKPDIGIK